MKLDAVVAAAVAGGFIAADKAPDLTKAILAADKRAKDTDPENTGMGPKNLQHTGDRAKDERESAEDEYAEAMDSRAAAADAAEEESDKDKSDKAAKDRKAARDARAAARDARKGARDKRAKDRAKDRNDDPEHTNPGAGDEDYTEGADPSPPGGHREKGKTAVDAATMHKAIADAVAARDALHAARTDVQPVLGATTFDSAGETYRKALDKLGIDTAGVPDSALRTMLTLAKDRASSVTPTPAAMDSAAHAAVAKAIPGINRLRK